MSRARDLPRAARAVEELLRAIGAPVDEDPELRGTGERVASAWSEELLAGYSMDPATILADATASSSSGLVVLANLPATTMCPHHLMPASGVAHIGYLPGSRVVGFGAIGALVDCFTRRLALQEDAARNIAEALAKELDAPFAAALLDLDPSCATARGDRRHGARALTLSFAGPRGQDATLRAELLSTLSLAATGTRDAAARPT